MKKRVGTAIAAGSLLAVSAVPALAASSAKTAQTDAPTTYVVRMGVQADQAKVQGMGFYPSIVTIDAGDRVDWRMNALEPHTVLFAYGAHNPTQAQVMSRTGSATFAGTGTYSSGLMFSGQSYALTFTQPGIYFYQSGVNPDMEGAVVVLPAGSPLPRTVGQAFRQGEREMQSDLNAGIRAIARAHLTTTPGPKGSTIYHVNVDVSSPQTWTVPLASVHRPSVFGLATLTLHGSSTIDVRTRLTGLTPDASYQASVRFAVPAVSSPLVGSLGTLKANASGAASGDAVMQHMDGIPGHVSFITISNAAGQTVAEGKVNYPDYGVMQFLPSTVTIHAGDAVEWTQNDLHEVHTVTFLKPGQKAPAYPSATTDTPAGGSVVNGPGFYNSGLMEPGQTYTLTFTKPGVYHYVCAIHDEAPMSMTGTVIVLPSTAHARAPHHHRA